MLDWPTKPKARGEVRLTIKKVLDDGLPELYDEDLYDAKCQVTYRHIYDCYYGGGASLYGEAGA